jgi:hypothetical protein
MSAICLRPSDRSRDQKLGIVGAIGLFIGLEREFSGKMGARTFAIDRRAHLRRRNCRAAIHLDRHGKRRGLMIVLINPRRLKKHDQLATTTSISFTIVVFCGILSAAL